MACTTAHPTQVALHMPRKAGHIWPDRFAATPLPVQVSAAASALLGQVKGLGKKAKARKVTAAALAALL